jgi:hypothetical protein
VSVDEFEPARKRSTPDRQMMPDSMHEGSMLASLVHARNHPDRSGGPGSPGLPHGGSHAQEYMNHPGDLRGGGGLPADDPAELLLKVRQPLSFPWDVSNDLHSVRGGVTG